MGRELTESYYEAGVRTELNRQIDGFTDHLSRTLKLDTARHPHRRQMLRIEAFRIMITRPARLTKDESRWYGEWRKKVNDEWMRDMLKAHRR